MIRRLLTTAAAGVVAFLLVCQPAFAAALPVEEPFRGSSTNNPAWRFIDQAVLTADGDGWLRLNDDSTFAKGGAVLDDAFPADLGVVVDFDYATYGRADQGNRGDGFSFFLMDGSYPAGVGISGGGLGYTLLQGGYVGIGFDEYGNFSGGAGGPGNRPNEIAVRGSSEASPGWAYLAGAPAPGRSIATGDRAGARHVRIVLTPASGGRVLLSVASDSGPGTPLQTVINEFDVTSTSGQPGLPPTFKIGFAGSTGGATDIHEIRDLRVAAPTDLSLTKTGTPVVDPGDEVSYRLQVANRGANEVSGARLRDEVPDGVEDVTWTCEPPEGGACRQPSGSGRTIDTALDLPEGTSATVTVTGTASAAAAGRVLENEATVTVPSSFTDLNSDDNTASAQTEVREFADLGLTKILLTDAPLVYGRPVRYRLAVANAGPGPARSVVVEDQLPEALDLDSVEADGCTRDGAELTCAVGALAPGSSRTFEIAARVGGPVDACAGGSVAQRATVRAASSDPTDADDSVVLRTPCRVPVALAITKSGPAQVVVGDPVAYEVTVRNDGATLAPASGLVDALPDGLSRPRWTCVVSDGSGCSPADGTGTVVSPRADIPAGGTMTVRVEAVADTAGQLVNAARVAPCAACDDADGSDDVASVGTVVVPVSPPAPPAPSTQPSAGGSGGGDGSSSGSSSGIAGSGQGGARPSSALADTGAPRGALAALVGGVLALAGGASVLLARGGSRSRSRR